MAAVLALTPILIAIVLLLLKQSSWVAALAGANGAASEHDPVGEPRGERQRAAAARALPVAAAAIHGYATDEGAAKRPGALSPGIP